MVTNLEHKSLKRQIQKATNLREIVDDLIAEWDNWPLDLYFDVKHRLLSGSLVDESQLAQLVVLSRSKTLYESRKFRHMGSLHLLFESGVADKSIEDKICENVESEFASNLPSYLCASLRLLTEYGSTRSLDILEALVFDYAPANQVAKLKSGLLAEFDEGVVNRPDFFLEFERIGVSFKVDVYKQLVEAIDRIKLRLQKPEDRFLPWSTL